MAKTIDKTTFKKCPVCDSNTLAYDRQLGANRCHNNLCRWNDKLGSACDVPMSFLRYCLVHAKPGPHKQYIENVIKMTEKR